MKALNRRNFLRKSTVGAAGIAVVSGLKASPFTTLTSEGLDKNSDILTRKLGNTGIDVPVVSIGCGRVDSPAVIKAALKSGIRHFDTAYMYQRGNSEKLLGETLKEFPRESFTIATKVKPQDSREKFLSMLDESLERLQTDYVDILYLHAINSREKALDKEMLEALKMAKESGKAKHLGISTHKNEPEVIQAAIDSNVYEVVLTSVNYKQDHYAEVKEKIEQAVKKGMGIVGMKVMAGGFLDKAKTKAVNYRAALKWVLRDPNVHTTIPSIINMEQLLDNIAVLKDINLNEQEKSDLEIASVETGLYCNACEVCVETCGKNLPVADMMRAYMYSYGYGEPLKAKQLLTELDTGGDPCLGCSDCTASCAKGFDVQIRIQDISRLNNVPDEFLT